MNTMFHVSTCSFTLLVSLLTSGAVQCMVAPYYLSGSRATSLKAVALLQLSLPAVHTAGDCLQRCSPCEQCYSAWAVAPPSTLPTPSTMSACSFVLVVALNTSGAVHYVVVPNSASLNSAASLNAAALTTQAATSVFPGITIAATGDISVPQAFLNVTQTVTVSNADGCGSQLEGGHAAGLARGHPLCVICWMASGSGCRAFVSMVVEVRHVCLICFQRERSHRAHADSLHMQGLNDSSDYIVYVAGRDSNTVPGPNYRSPPTELEVRCLCSASEQCAGDLVLLPTV